LAVGYQQHCRSFIIKEHAITNTDYFKV
jgi:hypothetical protein